MPLDFSFGHVAKYTILIITPRHILIKKKRSIAARPLLKA